MNETIAYAKRVGMAATETTNWILADNTIRQTATSELEDVLSAYTLRMGQTFEQYAIWRNGDLATGFAEFLNPPVVEEPIEE